MAAQGPLATSAEDLAPTKMLNCLGLLLRVLSGPHSPERKGLRVDLPGSREMGVSGGGGSGGEGAGVKVSGSVFH